MGKNMNDFDFESDTNLPGFLMDSLPEYDYSGINTGIYLGSYKYYLKNLDYFWKYYTFIETKKQTTVEGSFCDIFKLALKNSDSFAANLNKSERSIMDIFYSNKAVIEDSIGLRIDHKKLRSSRLYYTYSKLQPFDEKEKDLISQSVLELLDMNGMRQLLLGFHRDEVLYPERVGRIFSPYMINNHLRNKAPFFIGSYLVQDEDYRISLEGREADWINFLKHKIEMFATDIIRYEKRCTSIYRSLERRNPSIRTSSQMNKLIKLLFEYPIITSRIIQSELKISAVAANKLIKKANEVGIIRNMTNSGKNNKYVCDDIILSLEQLA